MHSPVVISAALFLFGGHPMSLCPSGLIFAPAIAEFARTDMNVMRPPAPVVILREASGEHFNPTEELSSFDYPKYWTAISYGPLSVEIRIPVADRYEPVEHIVLLLDGQPVENKHYLSKQVIEDEWFVAYLYQLPCPPPGKHILQARFKQNGLWSELSSPLHFDVRFPKRPEIISVFDNQDVGGPVRPYTITKIRGDDIHLRLAHVKAHDTVVAYLDGKKIGEATVSTTCCVDFRIANQVPPGVFTLTVRVVPAGAGCQLASEHSNEIQIHYFDEDTYLLKPGLNYAYPTIAPRAGKAPATLNELPAKKVPSPMAPELLDGANAFQLDSNVPRPIRGAGDISSRTSRRARFSFVAFQQPSQPADTDQAKSQEKEVASQEKAATADQGEKASDDLQRAAKAKRDAFADVDQARKAVAEARKYSYAAQEDADEAANAAKQAEAFSALAERELKRAEEAVREAAVDTKLPGAHTNWTTATGARDAARVARERSKAASTEARGQADKARTAAEKVAAFANAAQRWLDHALVKAVETEKAFEDARHNEADTAKAKDGAQAEAAKAKEATKEKSTIANEAAIKGAVAAELVHQSAVNAALSADQAKRERDTSKAALRNARNQIAPAETNAKQATESANRASNAAAANAKLIADDATMVAEETAESVATAEAALLNALEQAKRAKDAASVTEGYAAACQCSAIVAADSKTTAQRAKLRAYRAAVQLGQDKDTEVDKWVDECDAALTSAKTYASDALSHARMSIESSKSVSANAIVADSKLTEARLARGEALQAASESQVFAQRAKAQAADGARKEAIAARERARTAAFDAANAAANARTYANQAVQRKVNAALERDSAEIAAASAGRAAVMAQNRAKALDSNVDANSRQNALNAARQNAESEKQDAQVAFDLAEANADALRIQGKAYAQSQEHQMTIALDRAKAMASAARARSNAAAANVVNVDPPPVAAGQALRRSFFFASAAQFPLRDFGHRGQIFDGVGAVIYEDMEFVFNENGDYEVVFRLGTPAVPTTIELQLLIRTDGGAWHTLTLPPRYFEESLGDARSVHNHRISGHSEVLKRYFGLISYVRREGTARFGFGSAALGEDSAY